MKEILVYRLENKLGYGPFWGEQPVCQYLKAHKDPEKMYKKAGLNKKCFNRLCNLGWKFAWSSQELYDKFFATEVGRERARKKGFDLVIKKTSHYILFEDGQVLFKES